jgi:hypothetical protein
MNWIDELVLQHSELESPQSFWFWAGLSALSAVLKDNVWMNRFAYKLYPNIYVMLHADSGMKKGPPVGLAKSLVKRVNNTRVISGRSSIQGVLKELGTAQSAPGGKVLHKSVAFICASEFSSSLVADPAAMTILTDLYDRNYNEGEYKSLLKMESFVLKDPTITMLVATNEAHFEDFIQAKDIHGGFIGRMFIIAESELKILNPLISRPKITPDIDSLTDFLKEASKLQGEIEPLENEPAGLLYEEWYNDFYSTVRREKIKDDTGTIQRFGDSVLKVAMLLAISEEPVLRISEGAMQRAISICERLIGDVRRTTMGKRGKSSFAAVKTMIIEELLNRENHQVSRTVLSKKLWMHVNISELDEIMVSFHNAGMILVSNVGNQTLYTMPNNQVEELMDFLKGRNK